MPRRADINVAQSIAGHWSGAATNYIVQTPAGALYMIYANSASDVSFKKSLDGGLTWSSAVDVSGAYTVTQLAVWYDRWSGLGSDYISVAWTDSAADDTSFRTIDTANADALSTVTVIFAGSSTAAGNHLSLVRAKGGNVYCKTVIDGGAEGGFYKLAVADFPNGAWASRTVDEALATLDQIILLPDLTAADTQDIMAIFWDASANEISRKLHDDSANSWAEASISGSMAELGTGTAFANFDIAMDITNSRVVLVAWSATDTNGADLRCWTITNSAIAEVTNVVLNSADDQGLAAICIDSQTGYWHVFYCGASDGSETWNTALNVYTKASTDAGTTWGPETKVNAGAASTLRWLKTTNWLYRGPPMVAWFDDGAVTDDIKISVDRTQPRAAYQLGV